MVKLENVEEKRWEILIIILNCLFKTVPYLSDTLNDDKQYCHFTSHSVITFSFIHFHTFVFY